jgi:hypothetical protein
MPRAMCRKGLIVAVLGFGGIGGIGGIGGLGLGAAAAVG